MGTSPLRRSLLAAVGVAVCVALVTAGGVGPASASSPFTDVAGTHAEAIDLIAERGITSGCNPPDNDRYCPDRPVTRGQIATFLARALQLAPSEETWFVDTEGSTHEVAISALAEAGITSGCNPPDGDRFCPEETVTRAQMATLIRRGFDLPPSDVVYFEAGGPHRDSINALANAGITGGCDRLGTRYCASDDISRAQLASLLVRALGLMPPASIPLRIEPGDEGTAVVKLQSQLRSLGYSVGADDGVFGTGTERALLAFQLVHGLEPDGVYASATRAAMADPQTPSTDLGAFSTPLTPGQARNVNIRLAADIIHGDVIPPGGAYSLDEAIGPRTSARGFISNGFIGEDGLISVTGGGVSQMATTFLNAAWFAGIELVEFRPHTIYFTRYPMCREATLIRNQLSVRVVNDTPYPITVRTSHTEASVTVALRGAPWAEVDSYIGTPFNVVGGVGGAFSVTCGRTVHYPDGTSSSEEHFWRYQEGFPG